MSAVGELTLLLAKDHAERFERVLQLPLSDQMGFLDALKATALDGFFTRDQSQLSLSEVVNRLLHVSGKKMNAKYADWYLTRLINHLFYLAPRLQQKYHYFSLMEAEYEFGETCLIVINHLDLLSKEDLATAIGRLESLLRFQAGEFVVAESSLHRLKAVIAAFYRRKEMIRSQALVWINNINTLKTKAEVVDVINHYSPFRPYEFTLAEVLLLAKALKQFSFKIGFEEIHNKEWSFHEQLFGSGIK